MATCSHLYKKSTLPPLLDSYLPVRCRNQNVINQEKRETDNKKQMRNNKQALSDEEKDEIIKQALAEQHHLRTFKNLYRLRNVLCEHYRTLLNEKVQKQRIQMSNSRVQQDIKHKEKKKYIPSHKVPFCKLSHDAKYLESIPQSRSYLIIGLQNELIKLGILKNQEDYDSFWKLTQEGIRESKLKEVLPDIKAKMLAIKPLPLSTSARTNPVKHCDGLTNINKLKKSMTASLLQSSGTCRLPSHYMSKQMSTQAQTKEMLPKLLHSWLSEVQKKHGEQPSRTQQSTTWKRDSRYERNLHLLHHMYYFSLVNMASSRRLLEKNGLYSDVRTEQSIHDLMEYLFPNQHEQSGMKHNIKTMNENTSPSWKQQEVCHKGSSKIFRGSKEKKRILEQCKNKDAGERAEDQKSSITTFTQQDVINVPLTLEDAALYHPVVEVQRASTYWKNYADKDSVITTENSMLTAS